MHTEVDVKNANRTLVQGMYAEISLVLAHKDAALSIPLQAVVRNGSEATVLVVNAQNRLEERRIQLGLESNNQVEVLSGLKEGDRVLIGSRSEYRVGDQVEPKPIAENQGAES